MLGIILGIVLFMFLVIIHELGHFFAAKKSGVQVLEFGIGIPPKVMTLWTDKSGTEYTLNAIPLGGFVRMKGEDPNDPHVFRAKDSFVSASFWSKTVILLAGVAVNFLFAWIMLTVLFVRGLQPIQLLPENALSFEVKSYLTPTVSFLAEKGLIDSSHYQDVIVQDVLSGSIAQELGLQVGDKILSINGLAVNTLNFQQQLHQSIGSEIDLQVQRGAEEIHFMVSCPEDHCILGVGIPQISAQDLYYQFPLMTASKLALQELGQQATITLERLGALGASFFSGNSASIKKELSGLSGPVGAVKIGDVLVEQGMWSQFLAFGALISFALAVFNILPIPALDGGRWFGVIIQTIFFPKKIEQYFAIEGYVNFVCFILLMGLGIFVIFKDLVVIWGVPLPFFK